MLSTMSSGSKTLHEHSVSACELVRELYDTSLHYVESFEENPTLTATLLYLVGAIVKGTNIDIDTTHHEDFCRFISTSFPENHIVWSYLNIAE